MKIKKLTSFILALCMILTSVIALDLTESGKAAGTGEVTAYAYNEGGDEDETANTSTSDGTEVIDMSGVTLSTDTLYLISFDDYYYSSDDVSVTFLNVPYYMSDNDGKTTYTVTSSNAAFVPGSNVYFELYDNVLCISTSVKGVTVLTVTINGASYNITLISGSISMTNSALLQKGKKYKTAITQDFNGQYSIPLSSFTWSSTNTSAVSVSKSGLIKAKKKGNAVIYAIYGNVRLGCAVSVATKKTIKAIKKAVWIGKNCSYSQPKRMQSKYYDCSSLVWKAYKSAGITVMSKSYAPVAADIARWLVKTKKNKLMKFKNSGVKKMTYNAGDLGFNYGSSNGRFKNINHVEMFIGYEYAGYYGGKAHLYPKWANRFSGYYTNYIVHFDL